MTRKRNAGYSSKGFSYAEQSQAADCIICTRERPSRADLRILQVIEGLTYQPGVPTARILLDIISEHRGRTPIRYRVIHRGKTKATLRKYSLEATTPEQRLLNRTYQERLEPNPKDPDSILFHQRTNCSDISPEGLVISLAGPGSCFTQLGASLDLSPELGERGPDPVFTSYIIPPQESEAIQPRERAICRLELELGERTYERLVRDGSGFSVDSHKRLMRDIEAYELEDAPEELRDLYKGTVQRKDCLLAPEKYDIVVFQNLGRRVRVRPSSFNVTPGPLPDRALKEEVLWFFGNDEFYLELEYV